MKMTASVLCQRAETRLLLAPFMRQTEDARVLCRRSLADAIKV